MWITWSLVIAVSLITGRELLLTLITSILTFSLPQTDVLLGCVHLLLFGAYLLLMFDR